jgi:hypothetical protein
MFVLDADGAKVSIEQNLHRRNVKKSKHYCNFQKKCIICWKLILIKGGARFLERDSWTKFLLTAGLVMAFFSCRARHWFTHSVNLKHSVRNFLNCLSSIKFTGSEIHVEVLVLSSAVLNKFTKKKYSCLRNLWVRLYSEVASAQIWFEERLGGRLPQSVLHGHVGCVETWTELFS